MRLNDKINFCGQFTFKTYYKDGTVDIYEDKNLIMDTARDNMAQLVGGVTTGPEHIGQPINKFVMGSLGYLNNDITTPIPAGSGGFTSDRIKLFSEESGSDAYNYKVTFTATGEEIVSVNGTGTMYYGTTSGDVDTTPNVIDRVVTGKYITYTITIPSDNANSYSGTDMIIPFTEAALYAGPDIFSMKTFPARIKENSVKFVIEWRIIF